MSTKAPPVPTEAKHNFKNQRKEVGGRVRSPSKAPMNPKIRNQKSIMDENRGAKTARNLPSEGSNSKVQSSRSSMREPDRVSPIK